MIEYFLKVVFIYIATLFKFIAGPVLGLAAGLSSIEMLVITVSGMMTTVFSITLLGDWFRTNWQLGLTKKKKVFTPRTRKIVTVWRKYGLLGVAALTPLLLTPVGGTIILNAFNVKKEKIFLYMFVSAMVWGVIFSFSIQYILEIPFLGDLLR
ncbi:hypothetical protein [Mongoliitalea daihaiensis]|uniref:hypothetical protein n=1 Tax=Mongoliitalea daihaiensis TaxID=2782006 RepID=UPI001F20755E|nr:hypothetical protein [Mongoliitalea daihaiensis]UJP65585.1 hypothetical protein IPZ59_02855 [Mongoliitalea daihaiensis]